MRLLARCVPPSCHTMWCEEPLQPLLPLLLPRCNHAAPEPLGPSAAMIATPHLKSRFHPLPRWRGRRSYSRWERGSGERRAAVCEGAGGGERDGGGDRKREGRCTVHDDGVVDLLWYYYSYVSQEAIIRSVQFSSPSLVFFQQTSSSSASFFCTLLRRGFGESSVLVRNNPFSFQLGSTYLCKSMSCYAIYVTSTCMFPFSFLYI